MCITVRLAHTVSVRNQLYATFNHETLTVFDCMIQSNNNFFFINFE